MATYQDGNRRRATANTIKAQQRSAINRQCPKCERKSALVVNHDGYGITTACRWCDFATYFVTEELGT